MNNRMWKEAKTYPWSSVVGCGVVLTDATGKFVGQLGIRGLDKDDAVRLSDQVAELLNAERIDRYGVALMMIREGCDNAADVARRALERKP